MSVPPAAVWTRKTNRAYRAVSSAVAVDAGRLQLRGNSVDSSMRYATFTVQTLEPRDIVVSFDYQVSSEANYDFLNFYVNGTKYGNWSGATSAVFNRTFSNMPAGTYVFRWEYKKDGSGNSGSDCAWIDNAYISNGPSIPTVSGEQAFAVRVTDELYVFTQKIPNGREDKPCSATVTAMLRVPPYTWSVESGVLPPGVTLTGSPAVAALSGTPTRKGTYAFALKVGDTGTPTGEAVKEFTIRIYDEVVIETDELTYAAGGLPYSENTVVSGGASP